MKKNKVLLFDTELKFTDLISETCAIYGFTSHPVKEILEDKERTVYPCPIEEAEGYAIYSVHTEEEKEWIADVKTKKEADRFMILLQRIYFAGKNEAENISKEMPTAAELTAKENMKKYAASQSWVYLETPGIFFDQKRGYTYSDDLEDPIHIDEIDNSDWFGSLSAAEMAILEQYWLNRVCVIKGENPSAYPYRFMGDGPFQIHESNGEWIDADPEDFVIGDTCWLNPKLAIEGVKVPIGTHYTTYAGPYIYMWINENKTFVVWHWSIWNEANATDFVFTKPETIE